MDTNRFISWVRLRWPLLGDALLALLLFALSVLQFWLFTARRPPGVPTARPGAVPFAHDLGPQEPHGMLVLLVIALVFIPVAFRRKVPVSSLIVSGAASLLYSLMPWPAVFVILGPMLCLYTLASSAESRRTGMIGLGVGTLLLALPIVSYAHDRWVVEAVGQFILLAAATFLGESARSSRAYVAEVERRARDEARAHEEESRRRIVDERLRIARDVHDLIAHSLSIVAVQAAAADALIETDPTAARESVGHVRETSRQALSELRSMLDVLRTDDAAAPLGPIADLSNIETLVAKVCEAGLEVTLDIDDEVAGVPAALSLSAYRIVQEALTNVVRHASATRAIVRLSLEDGSLLIDVRDDGRGGDPVTATGHGLQGMAERVEALHGSLTACNAADGGFRVHATLPLKSGGSA